MVQFNTENEYPSRPTSSGNAILSPKEDDAKTPTIKAPQPRHFIELPPPGIVVQTPYNEPSTPMPNLLQTLGHPSPPPPTPGIPATPGGEELFFQVLQGENLPLGSPSDPSINPRINPRTKMNRSARPTPATVPTDTDRFDGGYFSIPTAAMLQNRKKRRSSATSKGSFEDLWTVERNDYGNGGLKNAVAAATEAGHPTETVCVGTLGYGTTGLDEATKVAIEGNLREDYDCLVAFTSNEDFDGHYNHYCKEVSTDLAGGFQGADDDRFSGRCFTTRFQITPKASK